jgi:hypothetical protein
MYPDLVNLLDDHDFDYMTKSLKQILLQVKSDGRHGGRGYSQVVLGWASL